MRHRLLVLTGLFIAMLAAPAHASACDRPDWYGDTIKAAAAEKGDLVPSDWGTRDGPKSDFAFIFCHESGFSTDAYNSSGPYYGLGQMGKPAIDAASIRFECYWQEGHCNKARRFYQVLGALRYCNQRYGGPTKCREAWERQGWW